MAAVRRRPGLYASRTRHTSRVEGWARPGGACERRIARVSGAAEEDHMAVYTDVADDDLRTFIALYDLGEVLSCKGIAEGVENSNFLVTTERGNFILTLYEKRVAPKDLPFFIALMEHLARRAVACPTPVIGRAALPLRELRCR